MKKKHLAVDLGSSTGKIILAEISGEKTISLQTLHSFTMPRIFINKHIYVNFYSVYETICETLRNLGRKGIYIDSLGVDSWIKDFGIVSPQGELISLPVFYRDRRTEGITEKIEKVIPYSELYKLTTQRRIPESTLGQLIMQLEENPDILKNQNKIMFPGDLVMFLFSRKICSEITAASYSQLFSMRKGNWEDKVFDLFAIPKTIQPEIVNAADCLGSISKPAADWYGINQFEIIAPAVHDTASAIAAIPVKPSEKNWAFIATGSWFLVGREMDEPADNALSFRYNFSNSSLAFGKTLLKRNIMGMWLMQECVRKWTEMGLNCDYQEIDKLTSVAAPFYAFIDTEDDSFFNPDDMPGAILIYLEKTKQAVPEKSDIGRIIRIIYESISMKCAYSLIALKTITQEPIDTLYLIGGASKIDILNRMIASATATKIITGPQQASSTGNALLQACGCGFINSAEEIREVVNNSFEQRTFLPENNGEWDKRYKYFCDLCNLKE
jgi:sugar (pentulose or hexulose) kinase